MVTDPLLNMQKSVCHSTIMCPPNYVTILICISLTTTVEAIARLMLSPHEWYWESICKENWTSSVKRKLVHSRQDERQFCQTHWEISGTHTTTGRLEFSALPWSLLVTGNLEIILPETALNSATGPDTRSSWNAVAREESYFGDHPETVSEAYILLPFESYPSSHVWLSLSSSSLGY